MTSLFFEEAFVARAFGRLFCWVFRLLPCDYYRGFCLIFPNMIIAFAKKKNYKPAVNFKANLSHEWRC